MPEGPSLVIAREKMRAFEGRVVKSASGTAKLDMTMFDKVKLIEIRTWGKHLLLCFKGFTIRIHFLMFGSYFANDSKALKPKLKLSFSKGELNFYTCAVKLITEPLDDVYDWSADVMNPAWDPRAARRKLKAEPDTIVADALLDQEIFSGVGNIIKNEVLFRIRLHPATRIEDLPSKKMTELLNEASNYAFDFLKWKKKDTLKKHWLAYSRKVCPRDGTAFIKENLGLNKRRTFYCPTCQKLYK